MPGERIVHGADLGGVAQCQTLCVRIKRLAEFTKVSKRLAQFQIRMLAVQQQTEDSLGGARIVDDLFGKENWLETIVFDDGTSGLVVLNPFEEKDQSVDRSAEQKKAQSE